MIVVPQVAGRETRLFTIGHAGSSAEAFFARLTGARVRLVLDTRVRTSGQLSAFAKTPDLPFFLSRICGISYRTAHEFAPSAELLERYRARTIDFNRYAAAYQRLLFERTAEGSTSLAELDRACLLCSEAKPERCHRRIAADYLRDAYESDGAVTIVHL